MSKPYVICHMASTIDGSIITANWGPKETVQPFSAIYEQVHGSYDSQAWMCGRVTMERDFSKGEKPDLQPVPAPIARTPFIADSAAESFAIALDTDGKLGWPDNNLGGDHIISVLTTKVADEYLAYLQRKGVSYIFAGDKELDFALALDQLRSVFGIETIMLEGGGHINGAMLAKGLIDEISLLIIPMVDGSPGVTSAFEIKKDNPLASGIALQLKHSETKENGVIWLQYVAGK